MSDIRHLHEAMVDHQIGGLQIEKANRAIEELLASDTVRTKVGECIAGALACAGLVLEHSKIEINPYDESEAHPEMRIFITATSPLSDDERNLVTRAFYDLIKRAFDGPAAVLFRMGPPKPRATHKGDGQ